MELGGRLGNQMFQVAAALSLGWEKDAQAIFPDFETKSADNIKENYELFFSFVNKAQAFGKCRYFFRERNSGRYRPLVFKNGIRHSGYFQSEKHFKKYKDQIIDLFSPSEEVVSSLKEKYSKYFKKADVVGIHVRGYGPESKELFRDFPELKLNYFKKAADRFSNETFFLIFSDNIPYAKKILRKFNRPHAYIEGNHYQEDFYLLSLCSHQILSSSTFGWWAAYLNRNPTKEVIVPDPWFAKTSFHSSDDITPDGWLKLRY